MTGRTSGNVVLEMYCFSPLNVQYVFKLLNIPFQSKFMFSSSSFNNGGISVGKLGGLSSSDEK